MIQWFCIQVKRIKFAHFGIFLLLTLRRNFILVLRTISSTLRTCIDQSREMDFPPAFSHNFIVFIFESKPIYITVNHRGPTRVFRISEFRKQQQEESRPEMFRFTAPRIGISFIDKTPSELLYFSLLNFRYQVGITNLKYNQSMSIEAIQVGTLPNKCDASRYQIWNHNILT